MRNFWLVARHEYRRMVFRRAFILMTLAIPAGMALLITVAILVAISDENDLPVGFLDEAGWLSLDEYERLPDREDRLTMIEYTNLDRGIEALEAATIQALFILPAEYPYAGSVELYYLEAYPDSAAWRDFEQLIRVNLIAELPLAIRERLQEGAQIVVEDIGSSRTFSNAAIINVILPFVASFLFFVATMAASGYMLQVVADEKESRTMEIVMTSLSPLQLIAGKMVGLLAAALTQLSIYLVAGVVGLSIAIPYVPELQLIEIPWLYIGIMMGFFLPAYVLIAAIMVAIGSAVTELQQGQQVAGILNLLFMLPILLLAMIFEDPSAPLLVFLSFFPTSSFLTISLRWGVASVPLWQIGLSWVILVASAILMVWAASRVFRAGMLRYGQPLTVRTALGAITGSGLGGVEDA